MTKGLLGPQAIGFWLSKNTKKQKQKQKQKSKKQKQKQNDFLIEEEEGLNDNNVVQKCVDIQNAIS